MNDYMQVRFDVEPCSEMATDVLAAVLAEIGYESFVPDERGVTAFVPQGKYDEIRLKEELSQYPIEGVSVAYEATFVAGRDWNEEWEKNYFKPIVVGEECVIHSTFHTDVPQARYDVLIDPKMAFGTGHHETTTLMLQAILASDLTGRSVLDMGCGTAVLGILARMKGAASVVAVDIDEFAVENAIENIRCMPPVRAGRSLKRDIVSYYFRFVEFSNFILLLRYRLYRCPISSLQFRTLRRFLSC